MGKIVNILVECPALIASVRVGVLEPLSFLEKEGKCRVQFKETIHITHKDIEWCDVLVTVRGCEWVTCEIVNRAKKAGRYVIYFLDDDLLHIPRDLPSGKYFENEKIRQTMVRILNSSDILWCVNERIGELYGPYCRGKWIVSRVPVIVRTPVPNPLAADDTVKVLFAGSSDHSGAVQKYLVPAVERITREYKDKVTFVFLGANPDLKKNKQVKYISFMQDYEEYKRFVETEKFDIGLAVIQEDDFYKSKYFNKFIEYTSIGAVGIYTKSEPYTLIVKNEINGFLADWDSWYETIRYAIDNPELRRICLANAREILQKEFTHEEVARDLCSKIPEIVDYHADKFIRVSSLNPMFLFYRHRMRDLWEENKLMFIPIISGKLIKKIVVKASRIVRRKR